MNLEQINDASDLCHEIAMLARAISQIDSADGLGLVPYRNDHLASSDTCELVHPPFLVEDRGGVVLGAVDDRKASIMGILRDDLAAKLDCLNAMLSTPTTIEAILEEVPAPKDPVSVSAPLGPTPPPCH